MLFVPADRPDRVLKAFSIADVVIIDLEDAVAPESRPAARAALLELAAKLDRARTIVRVNAVSTTDCELDLAAMREARLGTCMLAKAETADDIAAISPLRVIALLETPLGVISAAAIASAESCDGLMWGSEDLAAELGAAQSRQGGRLSGPLETARHHVLLAARAHGVLAIDAAFLDLSDDGGFRAEARAASDMGFDAKACVHPRQVEMVRSAFRPPPADAEWAERVSTAAGTREGAVFRLEGEMIDAPVIRRADAILRRLPPR